MDDGLRNAALRGLPSIGGLLEAPEARLLEDRYGRGAVRDTLRSLLEQARQAVLTGEAAPSREALLAGLDQVLGAAHRPSLRPIINATGIILHTNLGRAPLGTAALEAMGEAASGYCNLEFDLTHGRRGARSVHARELLCALTGAEDALVVNNNAAALLLALSVLAGGREVIVSRGELIEIGGAFRLPEVMAASGARMVEVGTTNRTRLSDYARAIGPNTAMIFKAHPSNFRMVGFTEEARVRDLADLARTHGLPLFFDQGSGLIRPFARAMAVQDGSGGKAGRRGNDVSGTPRGEEGPVLEGPSREPHVQGLLAEGADLVSFSGDKLLGGPQAGILVGRRSWIEPLVKAPLMRALRVDKLTYGALLAACQGHLCPSGDMERHNPVAAFLARSPEELKGLAEALQAALAEGGVPSRVVNSPGQCGGGSLPGEFLPSFGVEILDLGCPGAGRGTEAERLHAALMQGDPSVLGVLREGRLVLDVLAVFAPQIPRIAEALIRISRGQP